MANFVACMRCGGPVAITAGFCPACGQPKFAAPVPSKGISFFWWLGLGVALLVGIGAMTNHDKDKPSSRSDDPARASPSPSASRTPPPPPPPAINVTSDKLFTDYQANEVGADNKYKGEWLLVTGAVQAIKKDFMNDPYLELWTPNEFLGVHADFSSDSNSQLGQLSAGQHVTIRCKGGGMVIGSPILRKCSLE